MSDDVLSLRLSNGNKFLAVALLDNTVKVTITLSVFVHGSVMTPLLSLKATAL